MLYAKTVKGDLYLYFQYSDPGGQSRQAYVGKKTPALDRIVQQFQRERPNVEVDLAPCNASALNFVSVALFPLARLRHES
jgi:hypothetical protein